MFLERQSSTSHDIRVECWLKRPERMERGSIPVSSWSGRKVFQNCTTLFWKIMKMSLSFSLSPLGPWTGSLVSEFPLCSLIHWSADFHASSLSFHLLSLCQDLTSEIRIDLKGYCHSFQRYQLPVPRLKRSDT